MSQLDADLIPADLVDGRLLKRLLGFLRPYRRSIIVAVGLLSLHAALAIIGPTMTQRALDRAIPAGDLGMLGRYASWYVAALVATLGVDYAQVILTTRIGQRAMFDLRMTIFDHLNRLPITFFDRNPVGRLMTRVTSDVETLNDLFSSGVVSVFGDLFTLVAIAATMLAIDWRLAVVSFLVMPVMWVVVSVFRRHIRDAFRDIRTWVARLNSFTQEHLAGVQVVQLFSRRGAVAAEFDAVNRAHLAAHERSITIYAVFFPMFELVTAVALALLLDRGGVRVAVGATSVGVLAAFIQLTRRFFQPLQDLSEKVNLLQNAMASSERIFSLLDTPAAESAAASTPLPTPLRGEIRFENVWFRYADDAPWVLEDVSFTAAAGATTAVVGHTGAGKTTIVSLLLRYYEPTRGRITLDGVDIRELDVATLRHQFGFVQQDLFLFTGDILRNLALDSGVGEGEVREALARVGVDGLVARLPGGLNHVLAERGRNLSVGERQLFSFARALARNPRILLLDEATSSVDSESEARIQRGLALLMSDRTAIVVAHRLSTIQGAAQILVMHHGRVVERGRHDDLVKGGGIYRRLYQLQASGA